jgi:lysophospholipase L1-like esterase
MSLRPEQPEPFMRGAPYPASGEVPYPRANPTDTARLPADIWHAATLPAGVRIEVTGDAQAIDVAYRTTSGNLGYRGDGAGIVFSVFRGGRKVCEEEAALGDGLIRLMLGSTAPDTPATIYLPEGMRPVILSLTAVKGEIAPAPELPRWIAYGDSSTQGWIASGPAQGWAAIAARKAGLDLVNLGYAGAGRGEIVTAEHIAAMSADIISVAYGSSCWTRIPHSTGMVEEGLRGFLDVVRMDHPTTPIVVVSPLLRPDAEDASNKLGATLADIRHAIESVTRERIVAGDATLSLVAGAGVINAEHLADGIHAGDEGHKRIAAAVGKALITAMRYSEDAVPEMLTESLPNFGMTVITGGRSDSEDIEDTGDRSDSEDTGDRSDSEDTEELPLTGDVVGEVEDPTDEESDTPSVDEDSELPAEASLS